MYVNASPFYHRNVNRRSTVHVIQHTQRAHTVQRESLNISFSFVLIVTGPGIDCSLICTYCAEKHLHALKYIDILFNELRCLLKACTAIQIYYKVNAVNKNYRGLSFMRVKCTFLNIHLFQRVVIVVRQPVHADTCITSFLILIQFS